MMSQRVTHHGNVLRLVLAYAAPASETVDAWVRFCQKAAEEAEAMVRENPPVSYNRDRITDWTWAERAAGREPPAVTPDCAPLVGRHLDEAARVAALAAYRASLPMLTGRRRAQAYIACIAAGAQLGYIKGDDAKPMFYAAQLALQAYSKRNSGGGQRRKQPQPHPIGRRVGGEPGAEVSE